jgi:hypothetical protein
MCKCWRRRVEEVGAKQRSAHDALEDVYVIVSEYFWRVNMPRLMIHQDVL